MNWITILSLFLICSFSRAAEAFIRLTDENFADAIKNNSVILVNFVAANCANCKAIKAACREALPMLKERKITCKMAKIDATTQPLTSEEYRIQTFPTVILFVNSTPHHYKGERDAMSLVRFIGKMTGPASTELNADDLKARMADIDLRVLIHLISIVHSSVR